MRRTLRTKRREEKFGWPTTQTNECQNLLVSFGASLDSIPVSAKRKVNKFELIEPHFKQGLSISEIANITGFSRYIVWREINLHKKRIRNAKPSLLEAWRKNAGRKAAKPPFGYCVFEGMVTKEPVEYPALQLISRLWNQGGSVNSIMDKLKEKKIKSRTNKEWAYGVIRTIVQRIDDGTYQKWESKLNSPKT